MGVDACQHCAIQADIARASFLEEALALDINAPDGKGKVDESTRFVASVNDAKVSHTGSYGSVQRTTSKESASQSAHQRPVVSFVLEGVP